MAALHTPPQPGDKNDRFGPDQLTGELVIPGDAHALVLAVYPRAEDLRARGHRFMLGVLHSLRFASLSVALGVEEPCRTDGLGSAVLAIDRLLGWVHGEPRLASLRTVLLGVGSAAAPALMAAALHEPSLSAVAAHSGEVAAAHAALMHLGSKAMLLVGADDTAAVAGYREAARSAYGAPLLVEVPNVRDLSTNCGGPQAVTIQLSRWYAAHRATPAGAARAGVTGGFVPTAPSELEPA
nr:hypothetical protein [uncultured Caldimonas sp.]